MLAFLFITENFYFFSGIIGSPQAFNRFQIIPDTDCRLSAERSDDPAFDQRYRFSRNEFTLSGANF